MYHWEVDGTIAGYEYTEHANVNTPVDVHLLDEMIRLPDGSAPVQLLHDYNIRLVDSPVGEWSQEHAYSLLQTMKSIPQRKRDPYGPQDLPRSDWRLTSEHVADDILVEDTDGTPRVTIAADAFVNATPRLALLEGKRGRYYSQRLHHALVRFVTSNG